MAITGDQRLLKRINRMALVRLVRSRPGLSRADLAEETGLTKSTVSLLAQELIDEGWLQEKEVLVTGSIGRRPTPLCLDGRRLVLLGVELGPEQVRLVALSLAGEMLQEHCLPHAIGCTAQEMLEHLQDGLLQVLAALAADRREVLGLGVGVPGFVSEDGHLDAPVLGWQGVPLAAMLRERLAAAGVPDILLAIVNGGDAAALGEVEFAPGDDPADPLLYLGLDVGISAGVIVGGRLLHGKRGVAGEVGHIQLQPGGKPCSCGREGCAEAYFGLRAMAAAAGCSVSELFQQAQAQVPGCTDVLEQAGKQLGGLLHNLWTVLDPARIVLGGPSCALGAVFVDAARAHFAGMAAGAGLAVPPVNLARFGDAAVAVGGAALVLHKILRPF